MKKKMDPKIKADWVAALRSGEFEQGTGELCSSEGTYCCLGVLSELAVRAGKADKWNAEKRPDQEPLWFYFGKKKGRYTESFLPPSVRRWAGLKDEDPSVPNPDFNEDAAPYSEEFATLSELNDNGHTFAEIADLIEKHL